MEMIDVTIVLPTKNAARYLEEMLQSVWSQQTVYSYEMVVVDSGSTDETLHILAKYPVQVHHIPPHTFNHGETRNLLASFAHPKSRYIVFLTQDATPTPGWLDSLIGPLQNDPNLAGVFSRHIPRADCHLPLARRMTMEWDQCGTLSPVRKQISDPVDFEKRKAWYCYFSNTSSALRRSVFDRYPFQRVEFGEDADWSERVLQAGYALLYQPASTVLHSHSYPLWEQFTQNVDHGKGLNQVLGHEAMVHWTWERFRNEWWEYSRRDFIYAGLFPMRSRERWTWVLYSIVWEFATLLGNVVGVNFDRLPWLVTRLLSHQRKIMRGDASTARPALAGPSPFISTGGR
ncbi:MAG: hypothetical protein NVSMB42_04550 [Herpetosiphon sp.]